MHFTRDGRFVRTDIWREGKWLDLWSVVHLLSGVTMGFSFYLLPLESFSAIVIAIISLTAYEMWEKIVEIEEALTNRVMDVVVGVASFVPTYLYLSPQLSTTNFILISILVLTVNVVMGTFGWIASRKAASLEARLRERYRRRRERRLELKAQREAEKRLNETQ